MFNDPDTLAAFSAFIVSGCVGTVQYWIESGMKESTEQMAILTEDFIFKRHPGAGKSGLTFTKFRALIKLQF